MNPSNRRQFLHLAAGTAALPIIPGAARAQAYPSRPVRLMVGYPPGGGTDIVARLIGQKLSEQLRQQFIIENRPGAAANVATEAVVRAPADGYTLLVVSIPNVVNATLYNKLSYNFVRDIAPVAGIDRVPNVMVVTPSMPVRTVPEFIAFAKANPGKVNMASAGNGTSQHISGELFKMMAGIDMLHVPYRGAAPALNDLLAGQVQVMFDVVSTSFGHITAGTLRALAVTTATRSPALPDIPTIGDFLPGYEAITFHGLGAPRNTSPEIVDKLNKEVNIVLADPEIEARLTESGSTVLPGSPAEFTKFIADETEKWGKVIRSAGIKAE
jgi:tripartite-type tricarboxylate transporter receptor subunit TctC